MSTKSFSSLITFTFSGLITYASNTAHFKSVSKMIQNRICTVRITFDNCQHSWNHLWQVLWWSTRQGSSTPSPSLSWWPRYWCPGCRQFPCGGRHGQAALPAHLPQQVLVTIVTYGIVSCFHCHSPQQVCSIINDILFGHNLSWKAVSNHVHHWWANHCDFRPLFGWKGSYVICKVTMIVGLFENFSLVLQ